MQGNDPKHTSHLVREYFEQEVMNWWKTRGGSRRVFLGLQPHCSCPARPEDIITVLNSSLIEDQIQELFQDLPNLLQDAVSVPA